MKINEKAEDKFEIKDQIYSHIQIKLLDFNEKNFLKQLFNEDINSSLNNSVNDYYNDSLKISNVYIYFNSK